MNIFLLFQTLLYIYIYIYNAIKLNSTDIGNLTEAQEGDILTYDGENGFILAL